jgi:hypothetical protein
VTLTGGAPTTGGSPATGGATSVAGAGGSPATGGAVSVAGAGGIIVTGGTTAVAGAAGSTAATTGGTSTGGAATGGAATAGAAGAGGTATGGAATAGAAGTGGGGNPMPSCGAVTQSGMPCTTEGSMCQYIGSSVSETCFCALLDTSYTGWYCIGTPAGACSTDPPIAGGECDPMATPACAYDVAGDQNVYYCADYGADTPQWSAAWVTGTCPSTQPSPGSSCASAALYTVLCSYPTSACACDSLATTPTWTCYDK